MAFSGIKPTFNTAQRNKATSTQSGKKTLISDQIGNKTHNSTIQGTRPSIQNEKETKEERQKSYHVEYAEVITECD